MELHCAGPDAVVLRFDEAPAAAAAARVSGAVVAIEQCLGSVLVDMVPSYASVMVFFDPTQTHYLAVIRQIRAALTVMHEAESSTGQLIKLPVYYSGETGCDLHALSQRAGLSVDEVVALHTKVDYRVYAIGFAPGFAYLGEVHERIATPRLSTPRQQVPAGSVAIADRQTAVYPAQSPGGWNLIGRCPLPMFSPQQSPPMRVSVGDKVRFEAIDRERYLALGGAVI